MTPFTAIIPKHSYNCPAAGCKKQYKTFGWLESHVTLAHPQCTLLTSTDVVEKDDNGDLLEGQTHRIDQDKRDQREGETKRDQGERETKQDQEVVAEDQILPASAPGIYQCPNSRGSTRC